MSAVTDPVRPGPEHPDRPDTTRRPDYEALGHPEEPIPESAAWNILSYLLAGLIGFALPAWFLDRWLGTNWIVLIGILAGTAVAMLTIWVRYGTGVRSAGNGATSETRPGTTHDTAPHDASPLEDKP